MFLIFRRISKIEKRCGRTKSPPLARTSINPRNTTRPWALRFLRHTQTFSEYTVIDIANYSRVTVHALSDSLNPRSRHCEPGSLSLHLNPNKGPYCWSFDACPMPYPWPLSLSHSIAGLLTQRFAPRRR